MKRNMRFYQVCLLTAAFSLIACAGKGAPPIAMKPVESSSGSNKELGLQPDTFASTLLAEVVKNGVPQEVAAAAFAKYDQFVSHVKKTDWIAAIDFTKASNVPRFFMINTKTGEVDAVLVAHGSGSDPGNTGTPVKFSNVPNSRMSSLGAYIVSEQAKSAKHGTIARLDGLEATNSYVRPRDIILHSASYVTPSRPKMGMSWGCPAVPLDKIATALQRLSGGSFMYAYGPAKLHADVDEMSLQRLLIDPSYQWTDEGEGAPVDGE